MSNFTESFAQFMQTLGIGNLNNDLFIGRAPQARLSQDKIWWFVDNGGEPIAKMATGEVRKSYQILVQGRDKNYKALRDSLQVLEENLNCSDCVELTGYEVIDVSASSFPIDEDLDEEDRNVAQLQATVEVYQRC